MSSQQQGSDRRQVTRRLFQRVDVGVEAQVMRTSATTPQATSPLVHPLVVELSATGTCLQVRESDIAVGDALALDLILDDIPYHTEGVVVWVRTIPEIAGARLGLQFEGMPQTQKSLLARHIVGRKHRLPPRPTSVAPPHGSGRRGTDS